MTAPTENPTGWIERIAVEAALGRIADVLRGEGFADEDAALAEAQERGWIEGSHVTDAGFEVA